MLTTELPEISMVSAPRTTRARPFSPVRIVAPGVRIASLVSAAGCAPGVTTQTSPDDLLTRQPESCAIASNPAASVTSIDSRNQAQNVMVLLSMMAASNPIGFHRDATCIRNCRLEHMLSTMFQNLIITIEQKVLRLVNHNNLIFYSAKSVAAIGGRHRRIDPVRRALSGLATITPHPALSQLERRISPSCGTVVHPKLWVTEPPIIDR